MLWACSICIRSRRLISSNWQRVSSIHFPNFMTNPAVGGSARSLRLRAQS